MPILIVSMALLVGCLLAAMVLLIGRRSPMRSARTSPRGGGDAAWFSSFGDSSDCGAADGGGCDGGGGD